MQSPVQHVGQRFFHKAADLLVVVAGAEMPGNNPLVAEPITPLHEIVQMHVSVFVDFFLAMTWRDERHLGNQDLGVVQCRTSIKPSGALSPR